VWNVERMGYVRNARSVLFGEPERKKQLGRLRRRWEDNIRMDLTEIEWDWIHLVQDSD